ncbi:hypothetical protein [Dokdonia sp. Hel_I_53]|uniref:hypothetical protein n=1 Tax=Dokdonia sp. Hel_I_53 TaxID=1566287 RepID=UPI001198D5C8|nr:hypothetical protein [Dokdonia sp. Hel_I_53]TVZ52683.1 hypothetical protein OD90_1866 [Dokdonia sp. Hel_I_53]
MRTLFRILICITIIGCYNEPNEVNFEIWNTNSIYITDIKISNGTNIIHIDTLESNGKKEVNLKFIDVPIIDGSYQLNYKIGLEEHFKNFGYYSNGVPTNSIYTCIIKNDTILIKETMK